MAIQKFYYGNPIAFEGIDGSGKGTQAKRLVARLVQEGYRAHLVPFPQYESMWGKVVKRYLLGEFGDPTEVPPDFAMTLFALDRANFKLPAEPGKGDVIVYDRFVMSNMAHQMAKLDGEARFHLLQRIEQLEFGTYRLVRPQLNIVFNLPVEIAMQRMSAGRQQQDGHERSRPYLEQVAQCYIDLAKQNNVMRCCIIDCIDVIDGELTVEEIAGSVWQAASLLLKQYASKP